MRAYKDLLAQPPLRRLLLASIPADLADWLDYVAIIALIVYTWGEGPVALALLAACWSVPTIIVGPLAAAITDRTDLRWALVLTNLGRAATTFALIAAPNLFVLLAVAAVRAGIDSAFTPARQAALQAITPEHLTGPANGALFSINQGSKIVGPALGGLLLALLNPQAVFAFNGALSLLAAALLLGLAIPKRVPVAQQRSIFAEAPEGFREFLRNRAMLAALLFLVAAWAAIFLYDTQIALLTRAFGLSETVFGLTVAASGTGGVIGALIAGALPMQRGLPWMAMGALITGPMGLLLGLLALNGFALSALGFLAIMAVKGLATGFMLVPYRAIIQRETPPDRIARVYAAGEAVTIVVILATPFIGSLIADRFGVGAAFAAGGMALTLIGLVTTALTLRR